MLTLTPPPHSLELVGAPWHASLDDLVPAMDAYCYRQPALPSAPRIDDRRLAPEGYRLTISEKGIVVHCRDDHGYYYAIQTLRQILRQQHDRGRIPGMRIEDWPDFANRGVLLDISRDRIPTLAQLHRLIDLWAELKYNQVQLYMEAAFAYRGHEPIWAERSPLTADEIRDLDTYCRERGIELIANQNTFGHMERWLDHPDYRHLAENPGSCKDPHGNVRNHSFCLNPISAASIDFIDGLFDQLLPCFESDWVNINGDETFDLGVGASRERCETIGKDRVYLDYLKRIHELCAKRGKRVQFWADIVLNYPQLLSNLPEDAVVLNWGYEADHPFERDCARLHASGLTYYVVAATGTFAALTGRWKNCRDNVVNAATQGKRFGANGFYMSEWGDFGHAQPWVSAYPGYVLGAVGAWHVEAAATFNTERAVQQLFIGDGALTMALFKLANLYRSTDTESQLPCVSIFGALLFNQATNRHMKKMRRWYQDGFRHALNQCHQIIDALEGLSFDDDDQAFICRELLLTTRLAAHACMLGSALAKQHDYRVERLPEAVREVLAADLSALLPEYGAVWRLRSRPGGLTDSRARLECLLDRYRDCWQARQENGS